MQAGLADACDLVIRGLHHRVHHLGNYFQYSLETLLLQLFNCDFNLFKWRSFDCGKHGQELCKTGLDFLS